MPKATVSSTANATISAATPVAPSYEAALKELELLVAQLESGDMPLEQMLSGYQRGAELLNVCRDKLQSVENQIKVLDDGLLKNWSPNKND